MELAIGERVGGPGRDVYVVGECLAANELTTLHAARKVFHNYRYDDRAFYEAAEDEWIEVRIRSLSTSCLNDPVKAARGTELLRYEAEAVLGRLPGWFPEPLDWLERRGQPLLVISVPRGRALGELRPTATGASPMVPQIMAELLNLLEALHRNGQIFGCLGADDVLVDEASRVCCAATDRVVSAKAAGKRPRTFPPTFYPQTFAAPEVLQETGTLDRRSDLYSWSALFVYLMTGEQQANGFSAERKRKFTESIERLAQSAPNTLRAMSPTSDRRQMDEIVEGWCNAVERGLSADPRERPASVAALRRIAMPGRVGRFIRRLFGRSHNEV